MIEVGAVVLYAKDLETTSEFYRTIGVPLEREDHGEGPIHFAAELGPVHFAVYPASSGGPASVRRSAGDSFHGFFVDSLERVQSALEMSGAPQIAGHEVMPWGCRIVAQDPDGRAIEINQRGHCSSASKSS